MKQICVITGGSKGLGKELAREMLVAGNNVCLIARNAGELQQTKNELSKVSKCEILTFAGDVSDEQFVSTVFETLGKDYTINYLFNNAGVGRYCKVEENTRKIIDDVMNASLIGTILVTASARPLMKEDGTIINIMSKAALRGIANETAYCAAKWGQKGFTESLRVELANRKIKVVGVYPGGINTPTFWNENRHYVAEQTSERFMKPQELAHAIVQNLFGKTSLYISELVFERMK